MQVQQPIEAQDQDTKSPVFEAELTSTTGRTYKILPMTFRDLDEVIVLSTNAFVKGEAHYCNIETVYDDMSDAFLVYTKRCIEEGLGVVVRDDQDRLVSAEITIDQYNYDNNPFEKPKISKRAGAVLEFLDTLEIKGCQPRCQNDVYYIFSVAVDPAYYGQRIATEVMRWIMDKHPLISKVRVMWTQAITPFSISIFQKLGWKTIDKKDARLYIDSNGLQPFKDLDETSKRMNLQGVGISHLMVYNTVLDDAINLS